MVYGVEGQPTGFVWIMLGGGGAHDVPWIVKTANLEQFVPLWTVHRQVWSDSLTDILLFSDLHLSLTHHYRVQAWASAHCLSEGLHVAVTGSSASASGAALGYGVAVG